MPDSKVCRSCGIEKPLDDFHRHHKKPLGRTDKCKECCREEAKLKVAKGVFRDRYRRRVSTPIGAARTAWQLIKTRLREAARGTKRYRSYVGIEVRMTLEEFLAWAVPEYEAWLKEAPDVTPTLDRKDSTKHYEIGNLQLITQSENSKKSRANKHLHDKVPAGLKLCGRCKTAKPFSEFSPCASGTFGLNGYCRLCTNERARNRSPEAKSRSNELKRARRAQKRAATRISPRSGPPASPPEPLAGHPPQPCRSQ